MKDFTVIIGAYAVCKLRDGMLYQPVQVSVCGNKKCGSYQRELGKSS